MSESRRPAWKRGESKPRQRVGPLEVEVRDNDIEQAIRILRKKISDDGILTEIKLRRFAEKPSEKRRRQKREAIKKMRSKKREALKKMRNRMRSRKPKETQSRRPR